MNFTLLVSAAPGDGQAALTALHFARAVLEKGHGIYRVFFYGPGVHNASALACPPLDEPAVAAEWQQLAEAHHLDMVACVGSALRRGVVNQAEATRHGLANYNLNDSIELAGLGSWVESVLATERLVRFG